MWSIHYCKIQDIYYKHTLVYFGSHRRKLSVVIKSQFSHAGAERTRTGEARQKATLCVVHVALLGSILYNHASELHQ